MLILGQRNNDSLAREFDWFGNSERLEISPASIWVPDEDETLRRRITAHNPQVVEENFDGQWRLHEISPQVSVRDEDSLARPSALPEINPHVSVRDEDSFAKPRPLPEINPHVSVRDEDSFAKPRPLPEINPHVSVRDEDSFAKPRPLPEINPHVSVRDEDSFATPRPLPEINPHVSVRDDDTLAEPSALPVINPHVSVRDDASLPQPRALPEIHPQISILDESHASANEAASSDVFEQPLDPDIVQDLSAQASPDFNSGVCGIDESKAQPGEPTFVTLNLDGQNEKKFVQEYMELRPNQPVELRTSNPAEVVSSSLPELKSNRPTELGSSRPPQVKSRLLIELESSRPTELESPRPIEVKSCRPTELESRRPIAIPQVRVLDESQVLPGEASFATAIPDGPSAPVTHSPLEEFLAKTNMDLRTFGLATLLFVTIIGVSALVIMEATTGIFSSQLVGGATANSPSQSAEAVLPQSEVLSTTKSVAPVAVPKPSKQESQSMAPPREYSKFPGEVTRPMSLEGSRSDLSRKANSNDVRAEKADKKSAAKSESREVVRERDKHAASAKSLRANMKESGARKKVAEARHSTSSQKKTEGRKTNSTITTRKPVSASAKDAAITKPKVETKVPSASNGAQRPRTVTPRKTVVGGQ